MLKCVSNLLVCRGLIKSGERQDEESVGGRHRTEALRQLCQMNPSQAFNIRAMVVRKLCSHISSSTASSTELIMNIINPYSALFSRGGGVSPARLRGGSDFGS